MKITCNREQLLQAFQTVATVAPSRSPKPILQNVKLEVSDQGVELIATDLEIGIRHIVSGVDVQVPGSVILSVSRLGSIVRESTDEALQMEADHQGVTIRGLRSQFQLPVENSSEYPVVAAFQEDNCYEVSSRLLRELIHRTIFATDNESSRYALGGVKLEFEESLVTAIGTDGRRLAKMSGPISRKGLPAEDHQTIIVPTKAMHLIEKALSPSDAEVQLVISGNELLVHTPKVTISARLLEGRFPDWRKVFPDQENSVQLELAVGSLHAVVRQAAIVTSEESRGVDFMFSEGMLVLSGRAAEIGQSRVELPIGYDDVALTTSLDPRFVIDFLKVLDADKTFTMKMKDADSAIVCSTDDGFGYVIMPLAKDR